jgi:hypothetical protein
VNDLELFQGLARRVPLEPITDAETYYRACDMQDELRGMKETPVVLYLKALTFFIESYDTGYRADEETS